MPASANISPFLTTVTAILPLFGLMAVGVLARKSKLVERHDSMVLSRFAVMIALPALVLSSLMTRPFSISDIELPSLYWIVEAIAVACIFALKFILKFDKVTTGAALLTTFGNTGFMGYPMTAAIFPAKMPATILIDQLGMSLLLYGSLGLLSAHYGCETNQRFSLRKELGVMAKNPIFAALALGLIAHFALSRYPNALELSPISELLACLILLGSATIPVIMTSVGMRLSAGHAREFLPLICALGAVKMLIMPIAVWLIGRSLYHLNGETLGDCVLLCAMPPAAAATAFAAELKLRPELCVANFFVLTIASALTIPILMSILR